MFVKGKIKIGFDKQLSSFCVDSELCELNKKYQKSKKKFDVIFMLKNNGKLKNYEHEETFDEIVSY